MLHNHPMHPTLGIDLGTSSCKVTFLSGSKTFSATAHYPTHSPKSGYAEQDPADWLTAVARAVRTIAQKTSLKPAAIALSSAAHIAVLLDQSDQPLRRAILWSDQRSAPQAAALNNSHGKLILSQSFQAASTSWTLPHLAWLREHEPKTLHKTQSILLSKDYLLFKLTGQKITDPATAVSTQFFDARKNTWSPKLCALVGIRPALFPRVFPATAQGGTLTPEGAKLLNLTAGIPVILGTLDSATELLAAGISEPSQGMIRMASAGGLQCVVPTATPSTTRITYPHPMTPHWYTQSGTAACATSVAWGLQTLSPDTDYDAWDKAAASVSPGSDALFFHPYLAGERAPLWNPNLRGSFIGLTSRHTQAHLARAIYEGTAFSIRHAMPSDAHISQPLAAVGGGTKSALWLQILASVLNQPLRVVPDADSSTGAALIALAALDKNPQSALAKLTRSRARQGKTIPPKPAWAAIYGKHFKVYQSLSAALTKIHSP